MSVLRWLRLAVLVALWWPLVAARATAGGDGGTRAGHTGGKGGGDER